MSIGKFTGVSLAESLVSCILWVVAYVTRGWVTGSLKPGVNISAGLFNEDVNGQVIDLSTSESPLLTTIVLTVIGGFFDLVAVGFLVKATCQEDRTFAQAFICCSLLSGIFTIAGVSYYHVQAVVVFFSAGYSWYLALVSGILAISAPAAMGFALRRGEIFNETGFVSRKF